MVEMHNGTSQVVMKGTTLSMVHQGRKRDNKRNEARLSQEAAGKWRSDNSGTRTGRNQERRGRGEKDRGQKGQKGPTYN